jgi:hypothetical protein
VVFLDKTITATAVGNIQEACLKMAGSGGANAKMCWSFGELLTICKTFGKSNTLILGINAATHAYTSDGHLFIHVMVCCRGATGFYKFHERVACWPTRGAKTVC